VTPPRFAAASLAALLLAGPAGAVSFGEADLNRDGYVTYPEARRVFQGLAEVHSRNATPTATA
jgi:hypothetical protein